MTVTADMIFTREGTILPLNQRRREALMSYAQLAADDAGIPRQTWVRRTWGLKDYEAKDLLKANASETVWERILMLRGPHCGWEVALPVLAAVIGLPVSDFFRDQMKQAAKAAERAQQHEQLAQAAYRTLADRSFDPRQDRGQGPGAGAVGSDKAGRVAR